MILLNWKHLTAGKNLYTKSIRPSLLLQKTPVPDLLLACLIALGSLGQETLGDKRFYVGTVPPTSQGHIHVNSTKSGIRPVMDNDITPPTTQV